MPHQPSHVDRQPEDPETLASDGDDVIEGIDAPTDDELAAARVAHPEADSGDR